MKTGSAVSGAGLGLRRALIGPLQELLGAGNSQALNKSVQDLSERAESGTRPDSATPAPIDFFEVAPENWINVGGKLGKQFRAFTEAYPFVCHGLSLSLGGPAPLDETLLHKIRHLLDAHQIRIYSEHLSYCSDDGHLYDLLPIPFTEEAVDYVAARIRRAQDILKQRIAIENVSYYGVPGASMREIDFVNAVLAAADCDLLLDVNNVYVNSVNHRYDAKVFIDALPAERVVYMHMAGHFNEAPGLIVDSHAAPIIDPVFDLLDHAYRHCGVKPTLLERDFQIPPLAELIGELDVIREIQRQFIEESGQGWPGLDSREQGRSQSELRRA